MTVTFSYSPTPFVFEEMTPELRRSVIAYGMLNALVHEFFESFSIEGNRVLNPHDTKPELQELLGEIQSVLRKEFQKHRVLFKLPNEEQSGT